MAIPKRKQQGDGSTIGCTIICALVFCLINGSSSYFFAEDNHDGDRNCFCELKGSIDDCSCNVDTVDYFNNNKIFPRLNSLLVKDYFRFYKVNLRKDCPFWADDSKCAMKSCHVSTCEDKDIPDGLKGDHRKEGPVFKYLKENQDPDCNEVHNADHNDELSYLNKSISTQAQQGFEKWADFDEHQDNFCILDDHEEGCEYVDLLLNPEKYTGYRGQSANRIWNTIYLENCFDQSSKQTLLRHINKPPYHLNGLCIEQRAFYRLISGVHSSINIHLCSNYLLSESNGFMTSPNGVWGRNVEEFKTRFSAETTNEEGPNWLKNLYFVYLLELRALAKAAPYLREEKYFTGIAAEDEAVRIAVADILRIVESFPSHFNESLMFNGTEAYKLKSDFREKFRNISRIMDCVGCEKCRLWGKLQVQGLGTALKILFSGKFDINVNQPALEFDKKIDSSDLKLSRGEIVSLFNAFGRLSNSINQLEEFRKVLR